MLPFSVGLFFFSKKRYELAILFFVISIGSRINFFLFIIPVVLFFFDGSEENNMVDKLSRVFVIFFIGSLFYLPIWYDNSFNLEWLTAARPINQGFFGLLARFVYKSCLAIGYLQLLIIFISFFKSKSLIFLIIKKKYIFSIILLNIILFLYIPAELSYLQPASFFYIFLYPTIFLKNYLFINIFKFYGLDFYL